MCATACEGMGNVTDDKNGGIVLGKEGDEVDLSVCWKRFRPVGMAVRGDHLSPFAKARRMGHPATLDAQGFSGECLGEGVVRFFGRVRKAVRASHECPHLKIEIWGTRLDG
jgi:hypothetical protein